MASYYPNILVDPRTSCTRDEAVAILLGRRSLDPIYQDLNPEGDAEEVHANFMEWLDISILEELLDERDSAVTELADALDEDPRSQGKIDACRSKILTCDDAIRQAKQVLCDIDDELAKGSESKLRVDQDTTTSHQRPYITLSSLKVWSNSRIEGAAPKKSEAFEQPAPPANPATPCEPLLDKKGGMSKTTAQNFLVTFSILLDAFVEKCGTTYLSADGSGLNEELLATFIRDRSLPGARKKRYLGGQSVSVIETRILKANAADNQEIDVGAIRQIIATSSATTKKKRSSAL